MSVLIKGMEMPTSCFWCPLSVLNGERLFCEVTKDEVVRAKRSSDCPLVTVPPHGRLIDADALIADLNRQSREVFRVDAVSPDDFWITRNEAYNERLWGTWCESFFDYLQTRPTIIPAEPLKEENNGV